MKGGERRERAGRQCAGSAGSAGSAGRVSDADSAGSAGSAGRAGRVGDAQQSLETAIKVARGRKSQTMWTSSMILFTVNLEPYHVL